MNAIQPKAIPERLSVLVTLAHMLEKLENSTQPFSATQYRSVALRLADELGRVPVDDPFQAVLAAYPSTAQLYENLQYQHAGLCRSPLEQALAAELQARDAIGRAARGAHGAAGRD
jgi:hypothetical protein